MKISTLKIAWAFITGGKKAVITYLVDRANAAVRTLEDAPRERIIAFCTQAREVCVFLAKYADWCPADWRADFDRVVAAFNVTILACADVQLTPEELNAIYDAWRDVYAKWNED